MLVLSRKKSEVLRIGNHVKVVVVEIRGDKVRLGVEAPKELPVHREEVFDAIEKEKTAVGPRFTWINGLLFSDTEVPNALLKSGGWYICACRIEIAPTIAKALGGTLVACNQDGELVQAEFEVSE